MPVWGWKLHPNPPRRKPKNQYDMYPHIWIGCLNRIHRDVVNFEIPKGKKNGKCPVCGRRAGRK